MHKIQLKPQTSFSIFESLDIRVGRIIGAEVFPEARKPAYKLTIDFGTDLGVLHSSAQITELYTTDILLNSQIIAIVNFPPKQIGKFMSECLVLGIYSEQGVVLLSVNGECKEGDKVG